MVGWLLYELAALAATQPAVIAWGYNAAGQANVPPGLTNAVAISGGEIHSLALTGFGGIVAWGDNSVGQTDVPPGLSNAVAIAAGGFHSLALNGDATVVAWGYNFYHQTDVPSGLSNVVAIAGGGYHSLALKSNGTVVVWGDNRYGQTNMPPGLSDVAAISAGGRHSLALKSNGVVVVWGDNTFGQTNVPLGLSNVTAIALGGAANHILALRSNSTVVGWGDSPSGQTNVPPGLSNVVGIAAGGLHSLALQADGTVVAWGYNGSGQTTLPATLNGVTAIAAGSSHSLALGYLNDNFANRIPITGSNITFRCSNAGATSEPFEPSPSIFDSAQHSIWYTWTAPFSGGAVIEVGTDPSSDFSGPALAVYTGDILRYLRKVPETADNSSVADNTSFFHRARVVFDALAGQAYQIALDSTLEHGTGTVTFSLHLSPPPSNDFFDNSTPITGNYYTTFGSFIGASCEGIYEPDHGEPGFEQTLWWTWTAPTDNGVSSSQVSLIADAVSFPPGIGVYVGDSLVDLMAVPLVSQTSGMTRMASFTATAGVTYHIALAGMQHDPSRNDISPRYGNYRFRLNNRALALSILNLATSNPGPNGPVSFTADARIDNFGPANTTPLRVYVSALSGVSVNGPDSGSVANDEVLQGIWPVGVECAQTPANLVSWWRAEGDANDFTGAHNGALANGTTFAPGRVGQAFSFDGVDDYMLINAPPVPVPWTAEFWMNRQQASDDAATLLGDGQTALRLEQWPNTRRVGFTQFGVADYSFNYIAPIGTWVHLTFVANANNTQLYVNGMLQDTLAASVALPLYELGTVSYPSHLRGLLDDLAIYNRALTASEVNTIYCAGSVGKCLSPPTAGSLAPGHNAVVHICGSAPAPSTNFNATFGVGYGVYAQLQQQAAPDVWFTVDQQLVFFGNWPVLTTDPGPGGGVIRLDPGYTGLSAFNPLANVLIVGPLTVPEGRSANYTGKAVYADGATYSFTNTAWSNFPSGFTITTNGLFTAGSVTSNTIVTLTAPYSYAGFPKNATTNVTVLNILPMFSHPELQNNGSIALTLNGFPGRTNIIEATTNLAPPFWLPLATNATTNGLWNFSDPSRSNFNKRFYRALELQ